MLKIVNFVLVVCLLVAAFAVYSLEYSIKKDEREIARIKAETRRAHETIRLLDAEWAMLSRPERLQRLVAEHLKLQPVRANQFVDRRNLAARLPARPPIDPARTDKDPIADMLKGLNR